MSLTDSGRLLRNLRKSKGFTQKQVADKLGVCAKTVSKWETGNGFPDVFTVSSLAEILGVSAETILSGSLNQNIIHTGNMARTKFYLCPHCGAIINTAGESSIYCCSKKLEPLKSREADESLTVDEIENDYYITFNHPMSKEHYITFACYVMCDRILTVKLYPEQDSCLRFPKMPGGKLYFCCSRDGLFEYKFGRKKKQSENSSLTALMSAFSRAYHYKNSTSPVFSDSIAEKLFSGEEYENIERLISGSDCCSFGDAKDVISHSINTMFAPTPLARAKFCEESLKSAVKLGAEQYVILGCGYDTFSARNNNLGLKIFEIDKESTIKDKMKRLDRAGIKINNNTAIISADLSRENLKNVLERSGFDFGKKTFFSCLGLFYYMSKDDIEKLFKSISSFGAEGSTVVFDFADNHLFSSSVPRVKNMLEMAEQSGEKMASCFSLEELEIMLGKYDFYIYEFLNSQDIQSRYFAKNADGITAFEHIDYALAVLK